MRLVSLLLLPLLLTSSGETEQWWLKNFEQARSSFTGAGVVVAVIDTGIDTSHPDLESVVIGGADFSGAGKPDGTSPVGPSGFHATMVASLIAGQGEGRSGVIGIAPGSKLLSISVGLGLARADTDSQIAQAVRWAVDNGADIINLSISRASQNWPKSWDEAFLYAMQKDVVIVAASGNKLEGQSSPTAPATIPGVISVTAVDEEGNTSATVGAEGIGVSLAAYGVDVLGSYAGGGTKVWSGSSAAAPMVSGLLALMIEADPTASANDLIQRLIATATDLGSEGYDRDYGFGIINPSLATSSNLRSENNPLGSLEQWIELYRPSAPQDEAELTIPPQSEQIGPGNQPFAALSEGDPWSNPLLYLLVVPLALLLWFGMRNRPWRDGKKPRR
jgi:subtilisin family serine protease